MAERLAVVTGGASGLGAAAARRLAAGGDRVWILDRNGEGAAQVAAEIGAAGGRAEPMAADVADAADLDAAAAEIEGRDGPAEVLVTAAGIIESISTVLDADLEAHDWLWRINYGGTLNAARSFGRQMRRAGRGAIVTFGSVNSYMPLPLPAYCPSKTAILRLTEMLAVELGRHGVRVNGVAPTYVLTPGLQAKVDAGERSIEAMLRVNATGRMVRPEDVAEVVHFLASEAAGAVTGLMMPVDAGHGPMASYTTFAGGVPWDD